MNREIWERAYDQAFGIAGRVIAGVTHEVKNKLAVLQEQGSLIQDLALAAASGRTLDPERIDNLSGRLVGRVKETDEIVKRLNRFAHCADEPLGGLKAGRALNLMIDLHRRQADMIPVKIVAAAYEKSIHIETRPMFLLTALYACLEASCARARQGAEIRTAVIEAGPKVRFEFSWTGSGRAGPSPPSELLAALSAEVEPLTPGPGLSLTVPTRP